MRSERGEVAMGVVLLIAAGLAAAGVLIGSAGVARIKQAQSVGGVNGSVGWLDAGEAVVTPAPKPVVEAQPTPKVVVKTRTVYKDRVVRQPAPEQPAHEPAYQPPTTVYVNPGYSDPGHDEPSHSSGGGCCGGSGGGHSSGGHNW